MYSPLLVTHVVSGGIGLLTGFVALFATKGAPVHRRVGLAFVISMVSMSVFALLYMAASGEIIRVNVVAATLSAYLVVTALMTVREASPRQRAIDTGSAVVACSIGVAGLLLGYLAVTSGSGNLDGIPPFPYFLFGTVGTLAGIGDLRMIRGRSVTGSVRVARHLWRMSFALWIAALSFFLGQADEFPKAWRIPLLLAIPPLTVLVTLGYWMWRVRVRRSLRGLVGIAPAAAVR
jgi:uncharacterized membrane protein